MEKEMCCVCGEHPAELKGMCRTCYHQKYWSEHKEKYGRGRPRSDRRSEQTKAILTEYALSPETKQTEIAKKYGISRQRVSKIIKNAGLKKC